MYCFENIMKNTIWLWVDFYWFYVYVRIWVEVEVELYNEFDLKAPTSSHITQSIKTDKNGVFSFVMNHKGWWGFAALIEEGEKELNGKKYPIENGALLWLKAY